MSDKPAPKPAAAPVQDAAAVVEPQQQPPQPTPEQQHQAHLDAQRETMRVAMLVAPILKDENPHIAVLALLRVAAATALHTNFTPEMLGGWVMQAYQESKQANEMMLKDPRVLQMLGIKPGDPLPADIDDRIRKLMAEHAQQPAAPAAEPHP